VKARELRDLSPEELKLKLKEQSQEIFNLRLQKATGQLANTATIPKAKRDLARMKTLLRETETAKQSG
jgi:large subunit ribosomal protein L29